MTIASNSSTRTCGRADRPRIPSSGRARRAFSLSVLGMAAVALAACGSSSAASSTSSTSKSSTGTGTGTGGARPDAGGTPRQFPGASGTIAAISGVTLEVQNPNTGQTTVAYTPTTTFAQTISASAATVTVGSCISAFGKPTSGSSSSTQAFGSPVTATTVTISQPVSGSCTAGFGGTGRSAGSGAGSGGSTGQSPGAGSGQPPGGGSFRRRFSGQFSAASGSVTAVSGSTVDVMAENPRTQATSNVVVTLTPSTTFSQRTAASPSDLAVGKCAQALGTANSTGAISAKSINLSSPVSGSCSTGFGGFGRGRGAGAPGAESTSGA